MPVTHQPKGTAAGGQFAPASGSTSKKKATSATTKKKMAFPTKPPVKLSAAAIAYLKKLKADDEWSKKTGLPVLYGTKAQKAAQRKYYIALAKQKKAKVRAAKKKVSAAKKAAAHKRALARKALAAKKRIATAKTRAANARKRAAAKQAKINKANAAAKAKVRR